MSDAYVYVRDDDRRRIRVIAKKRLTAVELVEIVDRQVTEATWSFGMMYDLRALQEMIRPTRRLSSSTSVSTSMRWDHAGRWRSSRGWPTSSLGRRDTPIGEAKRATVSRCFGMSRRVNAGSTNVLAYEVERITSVRATPARLG